MDIALIGKAGTGKSTAAEFLASNYSYTRLSIASTIRETAASLWGTNAASSRSTLQSLGVAIRQIDPDTWINLALGKMDSPLNKDSIFVLDDVRFPNEYWKLRERDFITIRITADTVIRTDRLKQSGKYENAEQLSHESETALDSYMTDYTIVNSAKIQDLEDQLVNILQKESLR